MLKIEKSKVGNLSFTDGERDFTGICKVGFTTIEGTEFKVGKVYRSIEIKDNGFHQVLVYGVVFDYEFFEEHFEDHTAVVIKRLTQIGMVKDNGSMVSKTAFARDYATVHKYSRGNDYKMLYVGGRGNVFGIYAGRGASKKDVIDTAYDVFGKLLQGDLDPIVLGYVKYFTKGIPIGMPFGEYRG